MVACIRGGTSRGMALVCFLHTGSFKMSLDRDNIVTARKTCVVVTAHQKLQEIITVQYIDERQKLLAALYLHVLPMMGWYFFPLTLRHKVSRKASTCVLEILALEYATRCHICDPDSMGDGGHWPFCGKDPIEENQPLLKRGACCTSVLPA